jgi:hypothetical protein
VEAAKSDETQMRLLAHLVIKLIANSRERRVMADKYAAEHGADANGEDDDEDEEDAWQDEARLMKRPAHVCLLRIARRHENGSVNRRSAEDRRAFATCCTVSQCVVPLRNLLCCVAFRAYR